jgi:hypothetical protein
MFEGRRHAVVTGIYTNVNRQTKRWVKINEMKYMRYADNISTEKRKDDRI